MFGRKSLWFFVVVVVFAGSMPLACIPLSLHPLYTSKDVVFEEWLVGEWTDDETEFTFERSDENAYALTVLEEGKKGEFKVHMVRLGEHYFIDLHPGSIDDMDDCDSHWLWAIHMWPVHTFIRVRLEEDVLYVAFMDLDWLTDALEERKIRIKHETNDDMILLTASTSKLKRFVKKYADSPDAFPEEGELHRKSACAEKPEPGEDDSDEENSCDT